MFLDVPYLIPFSASIFFRNVFERHLFYPVITEYLQCYQLLLTQRVKICKVSVCFILSMFGKPLTLDCMLDRCCLRKEAVIRIMYELEEWVIFTSPPT